MILRRMLPLLIGVSASLHAATLYRCDGQNLRWEGNRMVLRASSVSFPTGNAYTSALQRMVTLWDTNPSRFRFALSLGDADIDSDNGQSEAWFSDEVDPDLLAYTAFVEDDCHIVEADVVFLIRSDFPFIAGNTGVNWNSIYGYGYPGRKSFFQGFAAHELAHVLGLHHETRVYNVLGDFHLSANGTQAYASSGEDANYGAVYLYGLDGTRRYDFGVTHWRWHRLRPLDEDVGGDSSLHRKTTIFNQDGTEVFGYSIAGSAADGAGGFAWDGDFSYDVRNGQNINFELTFENPGATLVTPGSTTGAWIPVAFYLSPDSLIQTTDRFLRTVPIYFHLGSPSTQTVPLTLPSDLASNSTQYIGAIVDPDNLFPETNDLNNATFTRVFVRPSVLAEFRVFPSPVVAPAPATGWLRLDAPANPGGAPVQITSSSPNAIVPPWVTIGNPDFVHDFVINTVSPLCSEIATITAARGPSYQQSLTINGAGDQGVCAWRLPIMEWFETLHYCIDAASAPGFHSADMPERCGGTASCPGCVRAFDGKAMSLPNPVRDFLRSSVDFLLHHGDPAAHRRLADGVRGVGAGPFFTAQLKQQLIQRIESTPRADSELLQFIANAGSAAFLDGIGAKPWYAATRQSGDTDAQFGPVAHVTGIARGADVKMDVRPGIAALPSEFDVVWPAVTYAFRGKADPPTGGHRVTLSLGGLQHRAPSENLRLLAWTGQQYKDVTSSVDLKRGEISGEIEKLMPLVIASARY